MSDSQLRNWFTDARYGLFVHFGLYSLLGRGEWALNREQIPLPAYQALAQRFNPDRFDADLLCDLAVRGGMRYVIFTTMHHDGFCLYNTALSDFNSVQACGRDLTAELIAAARRRGLRVALYHSLNHWTCRPDAVDALESPRAHEEFLDHTFARLRELVTNYNPVDVLWYDGWWPFDAAGWRAEAMNEMVRSIQPHLLFNGRNGLPGDFATPEGHLTGPSPWRPWEACMTLNDSWGYHAGDLNWKTPAQVVDMLATVAQGKGNLVLNLGPRGDGSIPAASVKVVEEVGEWLQRYGEAIYGTDRFTYTMHEETTDSRGDWCHSGPLTVSGNRLYLLARRWPGEVLRLAGLRCSVQRVMLLGAGPGGEHQELEFSMQDGIVNVHGLPAEAPDPICPVLRFDCDTPPAMYLCGGMRPPAVPHPHYDPCPSDIAH